MTIKSCPVDIVIPFVDCSDPVWIEDYESRGGMMDETSINGIERYRDNGTLRLLLMSIKKFMPWYNKIYLIVSHMSQVPEYAKDCCEIILHKDFIPKEFNPPVFSSNAIETWLGNLDIEEYFIYFNDDIILTKPWDKRDCLNVPVFGEIIPSNVINIKSNCKLSKSTIENLRVNTFELITGINGTRQGVSPNHGPHVFKLSWCKECLEKYYDIFHESCNPLKRTYTDFNQYVYLFYQYIYHMNYQYSPEGLLLSGYGYNVIGPEHLQDRLTNTDMKWVCLNDSNNIDIKPWVDVVEDFLKGVDSCPQIQR